MTVGLTPKVNPGIQTGVTNALGGFNRLNDKKYSYFKADDGDSDYPSFIGLWWALRALF